MIKFTDRNNDIVKRLDSGEATMSALAREFGIKRQRVSQIYYKVTGKLRGVFKLEKNQERRDKKDLAKKGIKFVCQSCGALVSFKLGKNLSKYCRECHNKNKQGQRDLNITLRCQRCKRKYHPYRTKRSLNNYCGLNCYHKSRVKK